MFKFKDKNYDYTLFGVTIALVLIGVIMVYSSSFYYAENKAGINNGSHFFNKQAFGACIGFVMMLVTMSINYKIYGRLKFIGLIISIVLLVLVFVPGIGIEINKSSRWINIVGFRFQPSEIVKALLIISIAKILNDNQEKIKQFRYSMLPVLLSVAIVSIPIALQPNYSAIMIICLFSFCMMFVGGARKAYLFTFIFLALIAGVIFALIEEHIWARLIGFWHPERESLSEGYQILQSLYAIGAGGAFGRGIGNSMQKFLYLPYGESDFIFAIICEELGFIGAVVIMVLFIMLIYLGIKIALKAPDIFGMLLATGITFMIGIQVVLNIAVATKSIPPTGIMLPFISAGSTALVIFMAEIGILLNISHYGNSLQNTK